MNLHKGMRQVTLTLSDSRKKYSSHIEGFAICLLGKNLN